MRTIHRIGEVKAGGPPVVLEAACPFCKVRAGVLARPVRASAMTAELEPVEVFHDDPMCETYRTGSANDMMHALVNSGKLVPVVGNR